MDLIARAQRLRFDFEHLRTFDDVHRWDHAALQVATELDHAMAHFKWQYGDLALQADRSAQAHAALPFFRRIFSSRKHEHVLRVQASQALATANHLGAMMNDLLECIDYSPNDERERKALLKELRAERKELQLAKRGIAAQKRAIHRAAKEQSADAGRILFFYDSKVAASERRAIRRQRYASLAPVEDQGLAIEYQMRDLDRRIMWVERFGADD